MNEGRGLGHGKVILLGEHAVVHGQPAIATALSHEVRVHARERRKGDADPPDELRPALEAATAAVGGREAAALHFSFEGDLPIAVGLGSSAALAVALVRALAAANGRTLEDREAALAANEVEKVFHGTPSGIDATTAAHRGLLWFEAGSPPVYERIAPAGPLSLVVALSGSRHHTGETVGSLGTRAERSPAVFQPIFRAIGELVRGARGALESGDRRLLGELMSMNHELLRACGVSTSELDRLVDDARACGALGAKLTGGGGGGAAIALPEGDPASLAQELQGRGWETFVA
ncbi:MAG: mevalonate kinase [Candidatus Binatia bacterium]|nr:mevalonate kinase [Candidatus Binatia bacterium]